MNRIALIKNQLKSRDKNSRKELTPQIVRSAFEYFDYDQFLTKEEREFRRRLRLFLEKEVEQQIIPYLERREFPLVLIEKLVKEFPGIIGAAIKGYGTQGYSHWLSWIIIMEFSRVDLSLATFFVVDGDLVGKTIELFGSEEQKQFYLPKIKNLELIGSFCLTEPDYGSDASSLECNVKDSGDFFLLNGKKRWIGNASIAAILVVFARNEKNKKVEAFIVETKNCEGLDINVMEGKLAIKSVYNCDITFTNVKVPKKNKLEKATSFNKGAALTLLSSRLSAAWIAAGVAVGAYDRTIKYCSERKQFGKPISSFQLVQEKIAIMMGNTQAILAFCKRASDLFLQGRLSLGQVGLLKAWCTYKTRETLSLAREALGGNGILIQNWVMKAFADFEACHTYEGTADINYLLAGKDLTGIPAFK